MNRLAFYALTAADCLQAVQEAGAPGKAANGHVEGQLVPFLLVRAWGTDPAQDSVNGLAFLDGNFQLWKTSVCFGEGPGRWTDQDPGYGKEASSFATPSLTPPVFVKLAEAGTPEAPASSPADEHPAPGLGGGE